jgi:hypothetical protein
MTIEAGIYETLKTLVSNRVYPDLAPANALRPYITYQQIGGTGVNFVDPTTPSKKNSRFQINIWSDTRGNCATIAGQVEDALRAATTLHPTVLSAPVASYEVETGLRGSRQDFSFWQ